MQSVPFRKELKTKSSTLSNSVEMFILRPDHFFMAKCNFFFLIRMVIDSLQPVMKCS